jgi:hypothetical protein
MLRCEIRRAALAGLLALLAMAAMVPVRAHADDDLPPRVGRVAEVAGELFLAPQDAPDQWVAIGLNYPVATGDNLWAGSEGRAEVDVGGAQFRLAGGTSLHISRLDDRNFALYVAQGRVILRVRVLDPGESARVDTPNGQVALTRPGLYRIDVAPDGRHTELAVREGEGIIDTGSVVQQVLPGQNAALDGAAPQFALVRNGIATDGFDTWSANRDRRYDRARVDSPVSRAMVGAAELDDYGAWETAPDYGAVWYPANVPADWAPYSTGYWTEVGVWGPTWVDAAPWGYAPFHYGRWAHIRGRWGWCPGGYVARPVWAPALVGWVGGPGWRYPGIQGGPVYGWVPLGWGEAYHPRWKGCSEICWTRYNKPYAVHGARPDAPPRSYVNATAPGAITAVQGPAFTGRKPVQSHRVAIPAGTLASAPVLAEPAIRPDIRQGTGIKPGSGVPAPASAAYAAPSRPPRTVAPGGALPSPGVPMPVARPAQPSASPQVNTYTQPPPRGETLSQPVPQSVPVPQRVGPQPVPQPAPQLVPQPLPRAQTLPTPQPMPQLPAAQGAAPSASTGQGSGAPPRATTLPVREPRIAPAQPAAPAPVPSPTVAPPAAHPVSPTQAPRVVPAPAPAGAPVAAPGDVTKLEKPAVPALRAPADVPAR